MRAPPQAEPPAAAPEPALRTGLSLTGAFTGSRALLRAVCRLTGLQHSMPLTLIDEMNTRVQN